jgi:hypothetical protein
VSALSSTGSRLTSVTRKGSSTLTTNRFIQFLQRISDPDYPFNAAVNNTRIFSMKRDLFTEFNRATQELQPQYLRRIELSDIWFFGKGEIRISTCELVIPEKVLVGESGGPLRARRIIRFADACIREGMAQGSGELRSGELRLSTLWQSEAPNPGEGERAAERNAKDWFFSNFSINR